MSDRVHLDWMVPESVWERFREHVFEEFGEYEGYLGREAEAAMQAFADADGLAGVEERIDQLVKAAGHTSAPAFEEKTSDLLNQETTRVTVRVDSIVKDEFRAVAKQGETTYGVAFARALSEYLDGGRPERLERKLDRILEDAEALLSEMQPGGGGLSAVERKVLVICNRLSEQFTDEELEAEIHDVAGQSDRASKPTLQRYRELVTERLEVEPHPKAPHVWVPREYAAELTPEGVPEECRRPVEALDRDARVRRLQLAVGRRAAKRSSGRDRVTTDDVLEDVFEDAVARSTGLELMEQAALTEGYELDRSRATASLRVNLSRVQEAEPELMRRVIEYRDADAAGLLSGTTETRVDDFSDSPSPSAAREEMNQLLDAATDGGGPGRD